MNKEAREKLKKGFAEVIDNTSDEVLALFHDVSPNEQMVKFIQLLRENMLQILIPNEKSQTYLYGILYSSACLVIQGRADGDVMGEQFKEYLKECKKDGLKPLNLFDYVGGQIDMDEPRGGDKT